MHLLSQVRIISLSFFQGAGIVWQHKYTSDKQLVLIFIFYILYNIKLVNMVDFNKKIVDLNEVKSFAQQNNRLLMVLDNQVLDVTSFAIHHPGGATLMQNKRETNIDNQMKFHHLLTLQLANSMSIASFKKDLERTIDPTKPLLSQIWNLNHNDYLKVVHSPHWLFTPSPQIFDHPYIDKISHTKWYEIIPVPIILSIFMFYSVPTWQNFNLLMAVWYALSGFYIFTLAEYLIHRFIFHSEGYLPAGRISHILHFFLHGIHHMLPSDPDRLVLPPSLSLLYAGVGYLTVIRVLPIQDPINFAFFWTFFLIGYCCYDLIHYALHHVDTSKSKGGYFHRLQQYHNQHHYGGEERGFGVSSMLWDYVFFTEYNNKKSS